MLDGVDTVGGFSSCPRSCKGAKAEGLTVLLVILELKEEARLVAPENGLVLPGGSKGLHNLGNIDEGSLVESGAALGKGKVGEGAIPSGDGDGTHGTGTPAVCDKYVTSLRSSSIALLCIRM